MRILRLTAISFVVFLSACDYNYNLHIAADQGNLQQASDSLSKGADPNNINNGSTPLLRAALRGHTEMARLLLEHGADPNPHTPNGMTNPFVIAACNGNADIVKMMLEKGADANALYINGETAFDCAKRLGHLDVAEILAAAGGKSKNQLDMEAEERIKKAQAAAASGIAPTQVHQSLNSAVTTSVDHPSYKLAENPNNFALVVGIEKYSNDLPSAQFAEHDARSVRDHLVALGYPERNIMYLTGEKASMVGIKKNLESWLPNHVGPDSTVFIYFSGHGSPDAASGEAYLVPWDGDPTYLKDTAYSTKRLFAQLGALKAKHVIVALDACFSGKEGRSVVASGTRPLVTKIDMGLPQAGNVVSLSASGSDEISGTTADQGHGLFTYFLLKGLNGDAANKAGSVTVNGLFSYLSPKVQDAARQDNREQKPRMSPASLDAASDLKLR
jgi:hypothetical protein